MPRRTSTLPLSPPAGTKPSVLQVCLSVSMYWSAPTSLTLAYKEVIEKEFPEGDPKFPMSEEEFREALNPVSIVHNRKTLGGPQPAELERMLKEQTAENHLNEQWVADKKAFIQSSLDKLKKEFETLGE